MKKQKRQVGKTLRLEEVTERLLSNPMVRLGYERRGIMLLAERVLGTPAAAAQWLTSPQVGLGGKVPTELLRSAEEAPQVERLLKQMQR